MTATYRIDYSDDTGKVTEQTFGERFLAACLAARKLSRTLSTLVYVIRTENYSDNGQIVFDNGTRVTVGWEIL